jgi:hypothetical protein
MTTKITFAFAAALLAGSTLVASADTMIHDSNTGLETRYYYDTLANLERLGLPISDPARTYLKQHGGAATVAGKRGHVYMLEDRPVYGTAPSYAPYNTPSDDKQRPW